MPAWLSPYSGIRCQYLTQTAALARQWQIQPPAHTVKGLPPTGMGLSLECLAGSCQGCGPHLCFQMSVGLRASRFLCPSCQGQPAWWGRGAPDLIRDWPPLSFAAASEDRPFDTRGSRTYQRPVRRSCVKLNKQTNNHKQTSTLAWGWVQASLFLSGGISRFPLTWSG